MDKFSRLNIHRYYNFAYFMTLRFGYDDNPSLKKSESFRRRVTVCLLFGYCSLVINTQTL